MSAETNKALERAYSALEHPNDPKYDAAGWRVVAEALARDVQALSAQLLEARETAISFKEQWEATQAYASKVEAERDALAAELTSHKKALALAGKAFRRILKNPADAEAVRSEADGWQHHPTDDPTLMVQLEAAQNKLADLRASHDALQAVEPSLRACVFGWMGRVDSGPKRAQILAALDFLLPHSETLR